MAWAGRYRQTDGQTNMDRLTISLSTAEGPRQLVMALAGSLFFQ
jgi:hypothetical protein